MIYKRIVVTNCQIVWPVVDGDCPRCLHCPLEDFVEIKAICSVSGSSVIWRQRLTVWQMSLGTSLRICQVETKILPWIFARALSFWPA